MSFGGSKEESVVILRDTGSIQTLMVGDPKSLPAESNTRTSVSLRSVNGGVRSVPLFKVNLHSEVVSGEVVVGVVSSLPMKGISFLLGNDVAGGRVKASPIIPKSPVCEENSQVRDSPKSEKSKVRDNLPSRTRLSESTGSCGVNEARRTPGHHTGRGHFLLRDARVQSRGRSRLKQVSRS